MKKLNQLSLFLLSVFFLISVIPGCKKKDKNSPSPSNSSNNTNSSNSSSVLYELSATVDSTSFDWKIITGDEPYEGYTGNSADVASSPNSQSNFIYKAGITNDNTGESYEIHYGTLHTYEYPVSDSLFYAYITEGAKSYSKGAANGMEVVYFDSTGVEWSTSNGDQSASALTLSNLEKDNSTGNAYISFEVAFNCKLYDGKGHVKTITNGKGKLEFDNAFK